MRASHRDEPADAEPVPHVRAGVPGPRGAEVPLAARASPAEDHGLGRESRPVHLRWGLRAQAPRLDLRVTPAEASPTEGSPTCPRCRFPTSSSRVPGTLLRFPEPAGYCPTPEPAAPCPCPCQLPVAPCPCCSPAAPCPCRGPEQAAPCPCRGPEQADPCPCPGPEQAAPGPCPGPEQAAPGPCPRSCRAPRRPPGSLRGSRGSYPWLCWSSPGRSGARCTPQPEVRHDRPRPGTRWPP